MRFMCRVLLLLCNIHSMRDLTPRHLSQSHKSCTPAACKKFLCLSSQVGMHHHHFSTAALAHPCLSVFHCCVLQAMGAGASGFQGGQVPGMMAASDSQVSKKMRADKQSLISKV